MQDLLAEIVSAIVVYFPESVRARKRRAGGKDLSGMNFSGADLSAIGFSNANLKGAILNQCSFRFAKFVDATLYGASMPACDFRGAGLTDMDLQESRLCTIQVSDAKTGKKLRDGPSDLSGAVGTVINLKPANMHGAFLLGVSFGRADLSFADFPEAEISGATMTPPRSKKPYFQLWKCGPKN